MPDYLSKHPKRIRMKKLFSGIEKLPVLEDLYWENEFLFVAQRAEILFDKYGFFRSAVKEEKIQSEPCSQLAYVIGKIKRKNEKEEYLLLTHRTVFRNETTCVLRDECLQVPLEFILDYKIL